MRYGFHEAAGCRATLNDQVVLNGLDAFNGPGNEIGLVPGFGGIDKAARLHHALVCFHAYLKCFQGRVFYEQGFNLGGYDGIIRIFPCAG
jgi:hypothetical protein